MPTPAERTDATPAVARKTSQDLRGRRYAVVGGGVSGLAAAWYLQARGAATHIFEREGQVGGRAMSGLLGDRLVALGGKNIGRSYTRFRAFSSSLGDHRYEFFGINSSRVIDGRIVTFDSTHRAGMLRNLSHIPPRDVFRLVRLVLMLKRDPSARFLSESRCRALVQTYGSASVQDAFSGRLCELILRSLTVRVSAAEPDEVPMSNVLPYLGMMTDTYDQLAEGMHVILTAAARRSRVSVRDTVESLVLERDRVCGVEVTSPTGDRRREMFDGVVVAIPADAASRLLEPTAPLAASLLKEIRYFPVIVLLVEYERPVFDSRVRAFVFGPEETLSNAGAYGISDLNIARYTFSGRRARALVEQDVDTERLATIAEAALAPHAQILGNPRRSMLAHRFVPGLCAYHQDQGRFLNRFAIAGASVQGLHLAGDYVLGCSIEACFAAAEETIAAV